MAIGTYEAIFVHGEGIAIDYTPASAVDAGEVIVQGELVSVAKLAIAADALGALHTGGVWDLAKSTGTTDSFSAGDDIYWDDTSNVATATSEGNQFFGRATHDAAAAATVVRVLQINAD